jgi:hypothetical protein
MDTTAALAAIADASTDIAAVGTAIIGVAAVVFAFRWIKASFF